jgi:ABC-2 type transport system permease protein
VTAAPVVVRGSGSAAFRFLLRTATSRGRLAALGGLGLIAILVGLAAGLGGNLDPDEAADLVEVAGLGLFAPLITLVLASAVLGEHAEDQTLVYLWMRPVSRARLAFAAHAVAMVVAMPFVVVPMVVMAALVGDAGVVAGAAAAGVLAVVGYTGIFVAIGLRTNRALLWGLVYVLVWEGAIASVGSTLARTSLRVHLGSVLRSVADLPRDEFGVNGAVATFVLLAVGALGVAVTSWLLGRSDVA